MKKVSLVSLVLIFAAVGLYAADPAFNPTVSVSGDASVKWGINLDGTVATGFANASATKVTVSLVGKDSNTHAGKEGETVYGMITLKDWEVKLENDNAASGTATIGKPAIDAAKIVLGPVYISVLGLDNKIDKASCGLGYTPTGVYIAYATAVAQDPSDEFKGIEIGLMDTSVVEVKVGVTSYADWLGSAASTATTYAITGYNAGTGTYTITQTDVITAANASNTTNIYNFYAGFALKAVAGLTLEAAVNVTTNDVTAGAGSYIGFGAKAGYELAVAEGYKLGVNVGFDGKATATFGWELGANLYFTFPGSKKGDWDIFNGTKKDYQPGVAVGFSVDNGTTPSATVTRVNLNASAYTGDLLAGLTVGALLELYDITAATQTLGLGLYAAYDAGMIKPYAKLEMKDTNTGAADTANDWTKLTVGFDLKVITNTTFTLEYASGDLAASTAGLGTIVFTAKVAY